MSKPSEDEIRRPPRETVLDDLDPKDQERAERLRFESRPDFNLLLSLLAALRHANQAAKAMTPHHVLDLVRRNVERPTFDGLKTTSGGEGGGGGGDASTTEAAMLAQETVYADGERVGKQAGDHKGWREPYDPTGEKLGELLSMLSEWGGQARLVHEADALVTAMRDPKPRAAGGSGAGDCLVCGRHCTGVTTIDPDTGRRTEDRRKSGLCPTHFARRTRALGSDPRLSPADWLTRAIFEHAEETAAADRPRHEHEQATA